MENKAVIALLQERGLKVDSPSNTIPNIYADALIDEYVNKKKNGSIPQELKQETEPEQKEKPAPEPKKPASPNLPSGVRVKSAADVAKEKEKKSPVVQSPEFPGVKKPMAPPASSNIVSKSQQQAPKLPPMPPRAQQDRELSKPGDVRLPEKSEPEVKELASNKPQLPNLPKSTEPKKGKPEFDDYKTVICKPPIVVRDFAILLDIKPFRLISELMEIGIFASMNQVIEEDVASKIAEAHGFILEIHHRGETPPLTPKKIEKKKIEVDESQFLEPRPPIVCVLGHVDHGKTTLLDVIRKANVVSGEAGGITQHIGAYQVEHKDHKITFIDTPGHAAFSKMRERGANLTDIAILVIAADDGFKPQTEEALKFAQKANVPVVVAVNKMDAKGANLNNVYQQMQQKGIAPEEWGGETLCTPISAIKGENIDQLLELILLQSEVLELKANPKCPAEGIVLESQIEVGRGSTATAIITKGTLKVGDALVAGPHYCKVKALVDDHGKRIDSALPATPVRIIGWSGAPSAGSAFISAKNEKEAKSIAEENSINLKREVNQLANIEAHAGSIDDLFAAIAETKQKTYKVIIKGDVQGSVEALAGCLEAIKSTKIKLEILYAEVGLVTKNDVISANTAGATIVAFNTKFDTGVQSQAKHHDVQIIQHNIIYELINQVKDAMADMLEPELKENKLGAAQVRQVFSVAKGVVAGCMVTEGKIIKDQFCRIFRGTNKEAIHQGKVSTLKRFKDDTNEVRAGYECGIQVDNFNDYQEGDSIECFEIQKIKTSL